jgi:tRNA threonylcarbamoyl adenosine modification protein (Sua5/YciO/YrdC/YwlC family)
MIKKKLLWHHPLSINLLSKSLLSEEISITSTDTIPGFLAYLSQNNFQKLNTLKGSRNDKPYLVLIAYSEKIFEFVNPTFISPKILNLLQNCWPGPLTVVFKAKDSLPVFLKSREGTIALRCPKHDGLLKLLQSFDGLFSTSANKSTKPAAQNMQNIDPEIANSVKYLVDDENTETTQSLHQPSTIIDATCPDKLRLSREGAFSLTKLEQIYGTKIIR